MQIRAFILILIFFPSYTTAEWRLVSRGYLGSVYLDHSTIKQKGLFSFFWQLQDFKSADKRGVKSRRLFNKVNCGSRERKILYSSSHSEHMGNGIVLISGKIDSAWSEPLPKSVGAKLISEVCS